MKLSKSTQSTVSHGTQPSTHGTAGVTYSRVVDFLRPLVPHGTQGVPHGTVCVPYGTDYGFPVFADSQRAENVDEVGSHTLPFAAERNKLLPMPLSPKNKNQERDWRLLSAPSPSINTDQIQRKKDRNFLRRNHETLPLNPLSKHHIYCKSPPLPSLISKKSTKPSLEAKPNSKFIPCFSAPNP